MNNMRSPKILFIDLDGTLIETYTGNTFAQGIWDMKFKFNVLDKIKQIAPDFVFIVTNQGGIGKFVSEKEFETKLDYISACVRQYIKHPGLEAVEAIYCPSMDKDDPDRKPNPGMLEKCCNIYNINIPEYRPDMLMVGDASGKDGQFSDSDKRCAQNFNIRYLDVDDFIKIMFE